MTKTIGNNIRLDLEENMPKATLTFSLPEERCEYNDAVNGVVWKSILVELAERLRSDLRYGHTYKTPDEALETIQKALFDGCNDEGLNLHD